MAAVRAFDVEDAPGAAELLNALRPGFVTTAEWLAHRNARLAVRAHRQTWVADAGGRIVGFAHGEFRYWGGPARVARLWAGVLPAERRAGIGSELYERALAHVLERGAIRLSTEVDGDGDGMRFATRLGYEPTEQEIASSLDPARADLSELEPLLARASAADLRLVPLRDVLGRRRDLFEFYGTSGSWPPAHEPETEITFDDFVGEVLESPMLEADGSAVLVGADGRIASLAVMAVDRERRRAENDWTGTLPELRERGLARLVKLATIRWARDAGLREIVTSNMSVNIAMLTVNQRLGYRELFVRHDLERDP